METSAPVTPSATPASTPSDTATGAASTESATSSVPSASVEPGHRPENTPETAVQDPIVKIAGKEYKQSELQKTLDEYGAIKPKSFQLEREMSDLSAQQQRLLERLKSDPNVFEELAIPKEIIEKFYYQKFIEPTIELSPEQKAAKYDQMIKDQKQTEAKAAEEARQQAAAAKETEERDFYTNRWISEIQDLYAESGLSESEFVTTRLAAYLRQASEGRLYHLAGKDIIKAVKDDVSRLQNQLISSMDAKALKELLGPEKYKQLRELDIQEFQSAKTAPKVEPVPVKTETEAPKKRISSPYQLL